MLIRNRCGAHIVCHNMPNSWRCIVNWCAPLSATRPLVSVLERFSKVLSYGGWPQAERIPARRDGVVEE